MSAQPAKRLSRQPLGISVYNRENPYYPKIMFESYIGGPDAGRSSPEHAELPSNPQFAKACSEQVGRK
jgi:hypothetical protein